MGTYPRKSSLVDVHIDTHCYGSITALTDCHFSIPQGTLCAIVGPNGGGKSTLLKTIAGLLVPTNGKIQYHGLKSGEIAYLAQSTDIDKTFPLHVQDVVAMGLWSQSGIFKRMTALDHQVISNALKSVGLGGFERRPLMALSGGQLQRLLFARAMAQNARLILLDEPFSGIDQPTIQDLIAIILDWNKQGKTVLAILHDINLVRQYFPQTALVARHLVAVGLTPDVLTADYLTKAIFDV